MVAEQEHELKKLRNNPMLAPVPQSDYEGISLLSIIFLTFIADLRQEVDRLTVGYAEVLQKLEQTRPSTSSASSRPKSSHGNKKRPQSASLTRSRLTRDIEHNRTVEQSRNVTPSKTKQPKHTPETTPMQATQQTQLGDEVHIAMLLHHFP